MTVTPRQLDASRCTHHRVLGDDPGYHVTCLSLQAESGCSNAQALAHRVVEPARPGLTGVSLDRERRNLTLLVAHWGDDPEVLIRVFGKVVSAGMTRIFGAEPENGGS